LAQLSRGNSDAELTLPTAASPTIHTAGERENTHYAFALSATDIGLLCRVVGVKPRAKNQIEISAINENALVHLE
jgi:hypothetical protein